LDAFSSAAFAAPWSITRPSRWKKALTDATLTIAPPPWSSMAATAARVARSETHAGARLESRVDDES
jgi:hypothetical protein